jgi:cytochrome o ubiquinol oxidase subunit II
MNAFFVPHASMIDTVNGMTTQLNLQADAPGTRDDGAPHKKAD